ncbi:MAG: hypothetical protein LUD84_06470 [Clostridiales bacterium]|nr:hypothetical protein [Clostridiales bacterium]
MSYKEGLTFSSDEIVAIYSGSSSEEYVLVAADREMTVESESYLAGVVGDHNSNPVRFRIDRYVDGGDLAECTSFYIVWQNKTAGTSGKADMTMAIDEDNTKKLIGVWLVDYETCAAAGTLDIVFRAVQEDSSGNIVYEWQTLLNSNMYINEGIDEAETDEGDSTVSSSSSDNDDTVDYYIDSDELTEMLEEVSG